MPSLTIQPIRNAVALQAGRKAMPTAMGSYELETLPAEIRLRAMFSAKVEDERVLGAMGDRLHDRLAQVRRDGRLVDRGVFIEEMRDIIRESGYRRPQDVKLGSLEDLKSRKRLALIFDMNVAQARGYARHLNDMDPDALDAEPCYELVRGQERVEHRDWPRIWQAAGGRFYGGSGANEDYPAAPGRMIAVKTDPIWTEISRFEVPWPPFDWGSGMVLEGIGRDEAETLGVIQPGDTFLPAPLPFNQGTRASIVGVPERGRRDIERALAGDVVIDRDEQVATIAPAPRPPAGDLRAQIGALPFAMATLATTALGLLAQWSADRRQRIMAAIRETVAFQRLQALASEYEIALDEDAVLRRAAAQYLDGPAGSATQLARAGEMRDLVWTEMDFAEVRSAIEQGGGA